MSREPEIVTELKRIAETNSDELSIVNHGVEVKVSYRERDSRLELRVSYDEYANANAVVAGIRPMCINLRHERPVDRHNKREGIDVEHQTGDSAFDAAIFVDTPTVSSLLTAVLNKDVRVAALKMFQLDLDELVIDDANGDVVATLGQLEDRVEEASSGARILHAFVDLVKALPKVVRTAGEHPENPLKGATIAAALLAIASIFGAAAGCDVDRDAACTGSSSVTCSFARPVSLAVGAAVSIAFGASLYAQLAKRYAGTSSSSDRINALSVATAFIILSITAYGVNHVLLIVVR